MYLNDKFVSNQYRANENIKLIEIKAGVYFQLHLL